MTMSVGLFGVLAVHKQAIDLRLAQLNVDLEDTVHLKLAAGFIFSELKEANFDGLV